MNAGWKQWMITIDQRHLAAIALLVIVVGGFAAPAAAAPLAGALNPVSPQIATAALGTCPLTNPGCNQGAPAGPLVADPNPDAHCGKVTNATIVANPAKIPQGQSTTLSWTTTFEFWCTAPANVTLNGQPVPAQGSISVAPMASQMYALNVGGVPKAHTIVEVELPPVVRIEGSSNAWRHLLWQALRTPGTTVIVASHLEFDLTYMPEIPIGPDVVFRGGRTSRDPGARFYTKARTPVLFRVVGDRVRITGLRIEGPEMGVSDADDPSRGIMVNSAIDVEIDHNELSGWSMAAITVWDGENRMSSAVNPAAVRIHDNYIHHNQHHGGNGYGVDASYGAHVQIARNVFDWNRHAIASDGRPGSGYEAIANLVLPNGGLHYWIPFPGTWIHTHQFDMHGRDNCGVWSVVKESIWNCGPAGSLMLIRHNTFLYTAGTAIKLRGTPQSDPQGSAMPAGMYIGDNVFKAWYLLDTVVNGSFVKGTVRQEESGLVIEPGNRTGLDGSTQLGSCDFDGDGVPERFMATGATWWISSGTQPWRYLNTSKKWLNELQLGDFDADGYCDVAVDGVVYSGGTTVWLHGKVGPRGLLSR